MVNYLERFLRTPSAVLVHLITPRSLDIDIISVASLSRVWSHELVTAECVRGPTFLLPASYRNCYLVSSLRITVLVRDFFCL